MLNTFYQIKSLEEWLQKENGCIASNDHALATLSVTPVAWGHLTVFPIRHVREEIELLPEELAGFARAACEGRKTIEQLCREGTWIKDTYARFEQDPKVIRIGGDVKIRRVRRMQRGNPLGFNGYENLGEAAGQLINHYHRHFIPRFIRGKGGGDAFERTHASDGLYED